MKQDTQNQPKQGVKVARVKSFVSGTPTHKKMNIRPVEPKLPQNPAKQGN